MKVHHYGFLTENIEKSIAAFSSLGYEKKSRTVDESRGIDIAFIEAKQGETIELIMPIHDQSVVSKLMGKLKYNIYHTCYAVNDIDESIVELRKNGFLMIDAAKPAVALEGRRVAFLYSKYAGMIELLES